MSIFERVEQGCKDRGETVVDAPATDALEGAPSTVALEDSPTTVPTPPAPGANEADGKPDGDVR